MTVSVPRIEKLLADLEREPDIWIEVADKAVYALPALIAAVKALDWVAANAEAWHGPEEAGHARALSVIAGQAREALAPFSLEEQA